MYSNNELWSWKEATAVTKLKVNLRKDLEMGSRSEKTKKHRHRVKIAARELTECQNSEL